MNAELIETRRATVDDLAGLRELWTAAGWRIADLEKRFTEFQVALEKDGLMLGCAALEMADHQGKLHSETYRRPELSSTLAPLLAARVLRVAQNRGLHRIWLHPDEVRLLQSHPIRPAAANERGHLPAHFGSAHEPWMVLPLRDDSALVRAEREFALLKQTQQESTERILRRARRFRWAAAFLLTLVFAAAVVGLWLLLRQFAK